MKKIKRDYKTAGKRYQNLSEEEQGKSSNMVMNVTKSLRR